MKIFSLDQKSNILIKTSVHALFSNFPLAVTTTTKTK